MKGIVSLVTSEIEGPWGRWLQSEYRPPQLAGLVDFLWDFEGRMALPRERAFPNGQFEIIVHLGERFRLIEGEGPELCPVGCIGGMYSSPIVVEAPAGSVGVLGIRLQPAGACALLDRPASEITGLTVDLAEVASRAAAELVERCAGAATAAERLRRAAAWVRKRIARSPGADPAIRWAAEEIERCRGAVPVAAVRDRTGWSRTRFAAAFREQIGAPPKLYARIVRFRQFINHLNRREGPLADLALEAGYYDQPHMNAEFRSLAGMTPGQFLASRRYGASPNLAEAVA